MNWRAGWEPDTRSAWPRAARPPARTLCFGLARKGVMMGAASSTRAEVSRGPGHGSGCRKSSPRVASSRWQREPRMAVAGAGFRGLLEFHRGRQPRRENSGASRIERPATFIPPSVFEGLCMHPRQLRVGDLVDDYCPRERRLSNHAVVALVGDDIRQVRCTTCDAEHEYRGGKVPCRPAGRNPWPGRRRSLPRREVVGSPGHRRLDLPPRSRRPRRPWPRRLRRPASTLRPRRPMPRANEAPTPHAEISLHRRLIRATLPRIESDAPARPIPEFTMHRAAPAGHGHRHGKPFRHGQGGGPHRHGGKGGFGQGRHGQGEVDGNTFGSRGGQGRTARRPRAARPGGHGGPGGRDPQGPRPSRHGFGGKPPRGPKKH